MLGSPLSVAPIVKSDTELGAELLNPADPDEKVSQNLHLERNKSDPKIGGSTNNTPVHDSCPYVADALARRP